jgi:WD40 repeat protein/serine/threonine protein kinase/tetratricopeptide (TPR) repeat protein
MHDASSDRNPVEALAEDFLERFRRGERPALSEYTTRYPALAAEIRELFPALVMLEGVRPGSVTESRSEPLITSAAGTRLERLGDYRILREVGRGGMGIVYEAEQESLGRHVALKVLPTHSLLDVRHLQRFRREARAAARLHHTNIVPVFGVGEADGLHYYVMQFIPGQGLDQVLMELQRLRSRSGVPEAIARAGTPPARLTRPVPDVGSASAAAVAGAMLSGVFALPSDAGPEADKPEDPAKIDPSPSSSAVVSVSVSSQVGQPYWQSVARIGIQAAEALAYAHAQGTLHRDIKPSNLLLDTQGIVWVTDFGLAKASDSEDLTHTGDVVGTLRYMAPERFAGQGDARSDVYSLGLTLYELLTLRPAFAESDRSRLMQQAMHEEPPRPRKVNPAVPRDLETIVLKAIARDPPHRYGSAAELAADLRRFLDDKPIQARRAGEIEKLWRWCRRNPAPAVLTALFLLSLVGGLAGIAWKWQEAVGERHKANVARNDAQQVLAGVMLDRGTALAEQAEVGEGLFWMLEALKVVPPDAPDLERAIRTNLAAWTGPLHRVQWLVDEPEPVGWCAFTPDGRRFVSTYGAGAQFRDTATGQPVGPPPDPDAGSALTLSPDGKSVVTARYPGAGKPGAARLRDAATGQPLGPPLDHPLPIRAAAFTPDGNQVATGDEGGTVRLWETTTGRLVGEPLKQPGHIIMNLAVSPDGKTLAAATEVIDSVAAPARAVRWDLDAGRPIEPPLGHQGSVRMVTFSPDGKSLLTASADRTAQIWDAATGQPVGAPLKHPQAVLVARFSPDGRTVATGGNDGAVRWWDAATGALLIGTVPVHKLRMPDLAYSPDGSMLVTAGAAAGRAGMVHVFRLARSLSRPPAKGKEALVKAAWALGDGEAWFKRQMASYSPDATRAVVGGGDGYAHLWDAATGQPASVPDGLAPPLRNAFPFVAVTAYSPDGRFAVTSSFDQRVVGEVRLWDAASGRQIGHPLPHRNYVSAMAFTPDSAVLATGGYDHAVHLWDTATRQRIASLPQPDIVMSLAISPDGKTLAVGHAADFSGATEVVLWDLAGRKRLGAPMPGPSLLVQFSPDGKTVVATAGSQLRFWDAGTGQPLGPVIAEPAEINSAAFSPDGKLLVLATTDGTVRMRAAPSGKGVGAPMLNPQRTNFAVFSPDPQARLVLAGYADGTARLWDRASQKPIGPPIVHGRWVVAATFTPDGTGFLTTSPDGGTRRWPVPTPAAGTPEQIARWLQVATGLEMGEGQTVVPLDPREWRERRDRLAAAEGSAASPTAGFVSDRDYHDARARDAEQENDPATARWHLDRLIAALDREDPASRPPTAWLAYARRGRTWTAGGSFVQAEADYARALELAPPGQVTGWYRHRIRDSLVAKSWPVALWYLNRAVAAAPQDWELYAERGLVWGKLGKPAERDADETQAVACGADAEFLARLADDEVVRGRWDQAAATYALIPARGPCPMAAWHHWALVCLKRGDRPGYRTACAEFVAASGSTTLLDEANSVAWVCALGPDAVGDYAPVIALSEKTVQKAPNAGYAHMVLNTLGALLYRAGRFKEAIARLDEGVKASQGKALPHDWLFLAMAHHRLGEVDQARKLLARVAPDPPQAEFSWERLELELLRQEAHALIEGKVP